MMKTLFVEVIMIGRFIEEEIPYTGRELSSHWAFRCFDILGDSIVSFLGPCDVPTERMADLLDVKRNAPIRSERMLHMIVEHFGCDLETAVLRQRLLICICSEVLNSQIQGRTVHRKGDDLFEGDAKLSVSIAVKSPVSCMIHAGLNVESRGTPVRTVSLKDLDVAPETFAGEAMGRYVEEIRGIQEAQCKVRGVS
jgi:hypothetical protein